MNWIKCSDRLPKKDVEVLAYAYCGHVIAHLYDINTYERSVARKKELYPEKLQWVYNESVMEFDPPTHWMPLPEEPKED